MIIRKLAFLCVLLFVASCAKEESVYAPGPMEAPAKASEVMSEDDSRGGKEGAGFDLPKQRMVIKTANVTLQSDDPEATATKARAIVTTNGGHIIESGTQRFAANADQVNLTVRVPAERFESTLEEMRKLGEPISESISGQDVTEEYVDVSAQLRNQQKLEARFLALLEQATTVKDTLEIERELARVRTEIDRFEGRRRYLADQVAMSTIHLVVQPTPRLFADDGPKLSDELVDSFSDASNYVVLTIGGLIRVAGALLPIAVLVFVCILVLRAMLRRRKSSRTPTTGREEE